MIVSVQTYKKMYFVMAITIIIFLTNIVSTESRPAPNGKKVPSLNNITISHLSTKEPLKEAHEKSSYQDLSVPVSENTKPLSTLWVYRPPTSQQFLHEDDIRYHQVVFKSPWYLTKLAKSRGFNPHFNKGYFGPFERRRKPVTLVALRRNGYETRKIIKVANSKSSEVAEIQSPYNDVSNFWLDGPDK